MKILNNDALSNLSGWTLTAISGELQIRNNDALMDISALSTLTSLGSHLIIRDHALLSSLNGLQNLPAVLPRDLDIQGNVALADLLALASITTVLDEVIINNNDALTNLNGLNSLTAIGQELTISNNDALTDLSALLSLAQLGTGVSGMADFLSITNNDMLTTLVGLDNIDHTTISDMSISGSLLLSFCEVESICDFIDANPGGGNFSSNAVGCSSEAEVTAACLALLPVEWVDFQVFMENDKQVKLVWLTASEENNTGFEIEKVGMGIIGKALVLSKRRVKQTV